MAKAKIYGAIGICIGAAIGAALYAVKDSYLKWLWTQYLPILGTTVALMIVLMGLLLVVYG